MRAEHRQYLAPALAVVLIDQITKLAVKEFMVPGQSVAVIGELLKFTFIYNEGGSFGIKFGGRLFHMVMSAIAAIVIVFYISKTGPKKRAARLLLSCVIGGAMGNFIDRIFSGRVVDFIDVDIPDIAIPAFGVSPWQFGGYELHRWFTFNVADMAITLGLAGYVLFLIIDDAAKRRSQTIGSESESGLPGQL